jgi:hypothetical protein
MFKVPSTVPRQSTVQSRCDVVMIKFRFEKGCGTQRTVV